MTTNPSRDRLRPGQLAGRSLRPLNLGLSLAAGGCLCWLAAQESSQFTGIQTLANQELQLTLTAPAGASYRIEATNVVRAMQPAVVYPYHYRDPSGSTANAAAFKARLGTEPGIEVRLRPWY